MTASGAAAPPDGLEERPRERHARQSTPVAKALPAGVEVLADAGDTASASSRPRRSSSSPSCSATRPRRAELLARRAERQQRLDAGELPDFLAETQASARRDWRVAAAPADLQDRRVEITGPSTARW